MEDSGIDSGDKINSLCFETELIGAKENLFIESDNSSNDNVEVVFRNPSCIERVPHKQNSTNFTQPINIDNFLINNNENDGNLLDECGSLNNTLNQIDFNQFELERNYKLNSQSNQGNNFISTSTTSTSSASSINTNNNNNKIYKESNEKLNQINSCKILQRKLELKVERAKKNYNQLHEEKHEIKPKSSNLIPITRLQIPGCPENTPLVEYNTENTDDDDDENEISFFPAKNKNKKQDLSDTFSIQEMTIESDSDDSESQNLELLPPTSSDRAIEKFLMCLCCINAAAYSNRNENNKINQKCVIM